MLAVNVLIVIGALVFLVATVRALGRAEISPIELGVRFVGWLFWLIGGTIMFFGHFTLQPNEARVLILFGSYKGTVRKSGFHWANPFFARSLGKLPKKLGIQ